MPQIYHLLLTGLWEISNPNAYVKPGRYGNLKIAESKWFIGLFSSKDLKDFNNINIPISHQGVERNLSISISNSTCPFDASHFLFQFALNSSITPSCPLSIEHSWYNFSTALYNKIEGNTNSNYEIFGYFVTPFSQEIEPKPFDYPKNMIIGHRGYGMKQKDYPENTMKSYLAAVRDGADGVEIDLRYSKDKILFSKHYQTLDSKEIIGKSIVTLFKLHNLRLDDLNSEEIKQNTLIPTFQQILTELPEDAIIDAEMKVNTDYFSISDYVDDCLKTILKYNPKRKLFFCSFDFDAIISLALKQQRYPAFFLVFPNSPDSFLNGTVFEFLTDILAATGAGGFIAHSLNALSYPDLITNVNAKGLHYFTWGIHNIYEWSLYEQKFLGIKGFIVDNISLAYNVIKKDDF